MIFEGKRAQKNTVSKVKGQIPEGARMPLISSYESLPFTNCHLTQKSVSDSCQIDIMCFCSSVLLVSACLHLDWRKLGC